MMREWLGGRELYSSAHSTDGNAEKAIALVRCNNQFRVRAMLPTASRFATNGSRRLQFDLVCIVRTDDDENVLQYSSICISPILQ